MDAGTLIIAVATVVTGIATCVSAFVSWDAWRGRISAEWEWYWSVKEGKRRALELTVTINNATANTLAGGRVWADPRLVKDVLAGNPPTQKHESWKHNEAPLARKIEPKARPGFRVVIQPDWEALSRARSRRSFRRSKSDALLRIHVTVLSRSARRWRRKFKIKIAVPREMIAAEIAKT